MLIDTHCHLFNKYFDNIQQVIRNAKENKVNVYISASDSIKSCKEMLDISKKCENIYICLGIHPSCVNDDIDELEKLVEFNLSNNKFIAVPCGWWFDK